MPGLKTCDDTSAAGGPETDAGGIGGQRMSDRDFIRLSEYIHAGVGIKLTPLKKTLLESRLQKRLRALGLPSFKDYCDYLFSPAGEQNEIVHMIDLVTTNKTDFLREAHHFDFLTKTALNELASTGAGFERPLAAWSAGCSTGEEPYTLAMVLSEYAALCTRPGFNFSILATDISTRVLEAARKGVYTEDKVDPVPLEMKKKYLLRSRDRKNSLVRVSPELRSMVRFNRLNFMDSDFALNSEFDIIFCRNVIIYFDRETQLQLFRKFSSCLRPGGYLFIGHSETLNGMDLPFTKEAPAVYRLRR